MDFHETWWKDAELVQEETFQFWYGSEWGADTGFPDSYQVYVTFDHWIYNQFISESKWQLLKSEINSLKQDWDIRLKRPMTGLVRPPGPCSLTTKISFSRRNFPQRRSRDISFLDFWALAEECALLSAIPVVIDFCAYSSITRNCHSVYHPQVFSLLQSEECITSASLAIIYQKGQWGWGSCRMECRSLPCTIIQLEDAMRRQLTAWLSILMWETRCTWGSGRIRGFLIILITTAPSMDICYSLCEKNKLQREKRESLRCSTLLLQLG